MATDSADELWTRVRAAERSGDLLGAYDLASRGVDAHPDDARFRHRAVLALARSGATARARERYQRWNLAAATDEDTQALGARLAKDHALAAAGPERELRARDAAERYAAIFARTGGHYPAINAATMWLLAGDASAAESFARAARDAAVAVAKNPSELDGYYALATLAEAALLLGERALATELLAEANRAARGDHAALATTRRQLSLVCRTLGADLAVLAPLAAPTVIHFTGHRIGPRFPPALEADVAARIAATLAAHNVGFGFGALASGADILFAEALLARGAELHVVLPFDEAEFKATSVADAGLAWLERFDACLARATSVRHATTDPAGDREALFAYAARLAMGLALLRAGFLAGPALQLAVWDGVAAGASAGTAVDVATWQRHGHSSEVIAVPVAAEAEEVPGAGTGAGTGTGAAQEIRALLFGDVKGFSKLSERQVPLFVEHVLGTFGRVLDQHGAEVRNTWGDGLYIVISDAVAAARCGLELQRALAAVDLAAVGLPPHLSLRLAGHVGPVYRCFDAVIRQPSFFGTHVTRTARIEPVTPEGEVFVTEEFAAAIALAGDEFDCAYVGIMPAAKGFGTLRMCSLHPGAGS